MCGDGDGSVPISMLRAPSRQRMWIHFTSVSIREHRECFLFSAYRMQVWRCCHCMHGGSVYFIIHIYECKAIYFKLNVNRNACAYTKRWIRVLLCGGVSLVECTPCSMRFTIKIKPPTTLNAVHWNAFIGTEPFRRLASSASSLPSSSSTRCNRCRCRGL